MQPPSSSPVLEVSGLTKHFPISGGGLIRAVEDVSFALGRGETLGVVGESGCGKTTLARLLVRLEDPTAGSALFRGKDLFRLAGRELKEARRHIQMVFQDPFDSLNPRLTVEQIISEPWDIHGTVPRNDRRRRVIDLLERVGMGERQAKRHPFQLSGGQRQRVGIARALALDPDLIICDEPVSALDVSVQAQVINLLEEIQDATGVALIFIAHDLDVVRHISDRVAVMYLGRVVEIGLADTIYDRPSHPYSRALVSAIPGRDERSERIILSGDLPSPADPPSGCAFRTRCWLARPRCSEVRPLLEVRSSPFHMSACHYPLDEVEQTESISA